MNIQQAFFAVRNRTDLDEIFAGVDPSPELNKVSELLPRKKTDRLGLADGAPLAEHDADCRPVMLVAAAHLSGKLDTAKTSDDVVSLFRGYRGTEEDYMSGLWYVRNTLFGPDERPIAIHEVN